MDQPYVDFTFVRRRGTHSHAPVLSIQRLARRPCARRIGRGAGREVRESRVSAHSVGLQPRLDQTWRMLFIGKGEFTSLDAQILREVQQRCLQLLQGVQREISLRIANQAG